MKYLREFKTKKHFLIYALMALCIFIVLILPYFLIDQQQYSNHFSLSRFLKMLLASILGLTLGGLSNTTGVFGGVLLRRLSNAGVSSNTSAFVGTATLSFMGIFALKQFQYSNQIPVNRGKVQNNYSDSSLHNIMNESPVFEKLSDHTKDNIMANQKNTKVDEKEDNIVSFADRNIIDSLQNEIANLKKLLGATEFDDYFTLLFKELKFDNFLSYSIRTPKEMKQYNKTNKSIDFRSEIIKNPERSDGKWEIYGNEDKEYAINKYLKINIIDKTSEFKKTDILEFKNTLIAEVGKAIIKSEKIINSKRLTGYYFFSHGGGNIDIVRKNETKSYTTEHLTFRAIFFDKASSIDLTNSHRILQVTIVFNQSSDKYWQKKLDLCMKFIEDLK